MTIDHDPYRKCDINEFNHLHHFFDDQKNYEELEMAIYCYLNHTNYKQ